MGKNTVEQRNKAWANPIRRLMLLAFMGLEEADDEEFRGVISPSDFSYITGKSVAFLAYHVRVLLECGCIELIDQEPRRGAVENFYASAPGLTPKIESEVALDLLGELLEGADNGTVPTVDVANIVRSTGRPIILAVEV